MAAEAVFNGVIETPPPASCNEKHGRGVAVPSGRVSVVHARPLNCGHVIVGSGRSEIC